MPGKGGAAGGGSGSAGRAGRGAGRTGRRPGNPDTRNQILEAARQQFMEHGYHGATIRGVARAAGVDPALVHRYFGDKAGLFTAAVQTGFDPVEIVDRIVSGGPDRLGLRIAALTAQVWDSPLGSVWVAAIQETPALMPVYLGFIHEPIVSAAGQLLDMPPSEARFRSGMLMSVMSGVATTRYISKIEPIASMPTDELVRVIAPILQHLIFDDLGPRAPRREQPAVVNTKSSNGT